MRYVLTLVMLLSLASLAGERGGDAPVKREPLEPNAEEQLLIYLLNKARSNPSAYGKSIELDLTGVAPQPALAVSKELTASSRFRADDMLKRNYFDHLDPDGTGPNAHALKFGYALGRNYKRDKTTNNIESISAGYDKAADILKSLIVDEGIENLGHRKQLLAMQPFHALAREIGVGILSRGTLTAKYEAYCAIHLAARDLSGSFVTGVVYDDKNANGAYDVGEGIGGATVSSDAVQTISLAHGGFTLFLPRGPYNVHCDKGGFSGSAATSLILRGENIHVEFVSGKKFGIVDFLKGRE
jgi:hypothetical protein